MNGRGLFRALLIVGTVGCSSAAWAQVGAGGYGGYLYGGGGPPYNFYLQDQYLPYYSLFPPVYYSRPVARPYGWSPFAYPPNVMTPNPAPEPLDVQNPHAPQSADLQNSADQSAAAPLTIINPFVTPERRQVPKVSRLSDWTDQ